MSRLAQETDPEILRKAVVLLENHNRQLTKKLAELLRELAKARAELAAAKGQATDKQLRLEALEQQIAKLTKQRSSRRNPMISGFFALFASSRSSRRGRRPVVEEGRCCAMQHPHHGVIAKITKKRRSRRNLG